MRARSAKSWKSAAAPLRRRIDKAPRLLRDSEGGKGCCDVMDRRNKAYWTNYAVTASTFPFLVVAARIGAGETGPLLNRKSPNRRSAQLRRGCACWKSGGPIFGRIAPISNFQGDPICADLWDKGPCLQAPACLSAFSCRPPTCGVRAWAVNHRAGRCRCSRSPRVSCAGFSDR